MADMLSSVIGRRVPVNVAEGESMRVSPRLSRWPSATDASWADLPHKHAR